MNRMLLVVLLALAPAALGGCSLVGLGVGSAIPRAPDAPEPPAESTRAASPPPRPPSSYWREGLVLGGLVDITLVAAVAVLRTGSPRYDLGGAPLVPLMR